MTSFKNLVFITHPITKGIMAKYRFNSGKVLSIVAGEHLYSTPNTPVYSEDSVTAFEVMFDEEVFGWQTREDINRIFIENN